MKKLLPLLLFAFILHTSANACNAYFTHSYACAGDTIFFTAIDQNAVYTWDFGDTASGVANISHDTDSYHVYNLPGTYYVTLFVNIGVEWDYQTQIINVGTDCFNAAFSHQCNGGSTLNFINESTGNNISSSWDFGDTTSGANDTSSAKNTSHTFSTPGNYVITLITSDGVNTDTSIQNIVVDSVCLFAQFHNTFGGDCFMDTTFITVYYTGQPVSYQWDFGDPASGSADTSSDSLGIHLFSAQGIYLVTLIISDGLQTDTFYNVQDIIDCTVWPGNINMDGEVNMEDLFAIGIYYGDTGTVRSSASSIFSSQPCPDWNLTGWNYMYLQDLVDKKHADCNGDGVVDALDMTTIYQNYGMHQPHYFHNDKIQMMPVTSSDPVLSVYAPTSWSDSANVRIAISLNANILVHSFYGIAARIFYDNAAVVPGSVSIDFDNSWAGTYGTDLIGLSKDFYTDGYIDFGMVRTNHATASGNGPIAYLNFTLSNFTGIMNFNFDPVIKLITNYSGDQEIFLPVSSASSQMNIISNSVHETINHQFSVYPNPVNDLLTIVPKDNVYLNNIILSDVTGRIIKEENIDSNKNSMTFQCSDVAAGLYLLTVNTSSGKFTERIEIRR